VKMDIKKKPFLEGLFLVVISALVFLPNIGNLKYFKDDWYYMYDGFVGGVRVFPYMFSIDRPARGVFFEIYYALFGPHPFPYHLGAFVWRLIAILSALWLFNQIWPKQRWFAFLSAVFFAIYPGYYWWVSAIEYQPMIASLALQVLSIALTIKAIQASGRVMKTLSFLAAILTGWVYIALVDYAIGMEVFRFLCVVVLVNRDNQSVNWIEKFRTAVKVWIWNIFIPLGYLLWRTFFFNNERKATDIGLQLSGLFSNPVSTLFNWTLQTFNSLLNLGVLAWVGQFQRFFFGMRLRDTIYALIIAGVVLLLMFLADKLIKGDEAAGGSAPSTNLYQEALLIGLPGTVLGILPVIMANRYINLDSYSHYALPVSLAAVLSLMGFIHAVSSRRIQLMVISVLVAFAALAHFSISVSALTEENAIQKFWWQVGWRVPALRSGTLLVINYPLSNMGDDGFGVMEAANMIYFPKQSADLPVAYKISAITLSNANLQDVLDGKLYRQTQYRSHAVDFDYANVLVLSQPTTTSCVHVLDGRQPLISVLDPGNVRLVAPSSNIDNVMVDSDPAIPQDFAFGSQPDHRWCYYFEKAELAVQRRKWDEVVSLGEAAIRLGLHPEDPSEWLPFLQAYAQTGNAARVKQTAPKINADKLLRVQACKWLSALDTPVTPEVQELISTLYCRNAQ
jgi:hypothetical protein